MTRAFRHHNHKAVERFNKRVHKEEADYDTLHLARRNNLINIIKRWEWEYGLVWEINIEDNKNTDRWDGANNDTDVEPTTDRAISSKDMEPTTGETTSSKDVKPIASEANSSKDLKPTTSETTSGKDIEFIATRANSSKDV